jgi:hypothetical protein
MMKSSVWDLTPGDALYGMPKVPQLSGGEHISDTPVSFRFQGTLADSRHV